MHALFSTLPFPELWEFLQYAVTVIKVIILHTHKYLLRIKRVHTFFLF